MSELIFLLVGFCAGFVLGKYGLDQIKATAIIATIAVKNKVNALKSKLKR